MKHFTISELIGSSKALTLKIDNHPNETVTKNLMELIETILEPLREKWGKPIIITSGYRCDALNKAVGGTKNSQHLKGQAADIIARYGQTKQLFELAEKMVESSEIEVGQLIDEQNSS